MTNGRDPRPVTTAVGEPIELGMSLAAIAASDVEILIDGEHCDTRSVSEGDSQITVGLRFEEPGEYLVELKADCEPVGQLAELQQQDNLEISAHKAVVRWDLTVEPQSPQGGLRQLWWVITNFLALREVIKIIRSRWTRISDRLDQSDHSPESDTEPTTLDDFEE